MNEPHDDFVRHLLAETHAGSPTPVPAHVAARLDDTLAELLAERSDAGDRPAPTDLSAVRARRRRRLMVGLGAAAAFVVAAGVAVPTIVGITSSERGVTSSMDSEDAAEQDQKGPGPVTLRAASAEKELQDYVAGLDAPIATPTPAPEQMPLSGAPSESKDSATDRSTYAVAGPPPTCEEPGGGEVHPVTYDGRAALLVLSGVEDDRVLAQVVLCEEARGSAGDEGSAELGTRLNRSSTVPVEFVVPQP